MKQLIANGIHLVTMMKRNAVAYFPPEESKEKKRGRPKKFGKLVKLFDLFKTGLEFTQAPSPKNPKIILEYAVLTLLWRPLGDYVLFVFVKHPKWGISVSMCTDLSINPLDVIFIYSLRFKIEVLFKQAIHQVGVFMYRFWIKQMVRKKRGSGDQQLHFAPKKFKQKVAEKLFAYHLFIQLGFIAQGLIQYLSIHHHESVWRCFGTWLRTIRRNVLPSEMVVSIAMQKTYIGFLIDGTKCSIFDKFIRKRINIGQLIGSNSDFKEAA